MCGIYGYIGKPTKKTAKAVRVLAGLNETRGKDSAGLVISDGQKIDLFKKAVNSSVFLNKQTTRDILTKYSGGDYLLLIGHTRAATRGAITDNNAHPFRDGHYYYAHNGIIFNFDNLQREYKTDFEVDSQIIGHLLNHETPETAFNKKLEGWFAVPYFHSDNLKRLYIARHTSPLAIAVLPDKSGMYFSSELHHLRQALRIAELSASSYDVSGSVLLQFDYTDNQITRQKTNLTPKQSSYYYVYADSDDDSGYYLPAAYRLNQTWKDWKNGW